MTFDKLTVKQSARGRWREIIPAVAGIDAKCLTTTGEPCPKCRDGNNRFSTFADFDNTGGVICRHCFPDKNGDGLATIAWFTGWAFPEVVQRVGDYLGIQHGQNGRVNSSPQPSPSESESAETMDTTAAHMVYPELLKLCPVSNEHREQLRARGLTDEQIDFRGYGTLRLNRRGRVSQLVRKFEQETLLTVPGFKEDTKNDETFITLAGSPGLLIPIRDADGNITSLQIRPDKQQKGGPKYIYLSSKKAGGPGPKATTHLPMGCEFNGRLRITEGVLKSDVATDLSGLTTIGMPGVSCWKQAAEIAMNSGVKVVVLGYDADALENPAVAKSLRECFAYLTEAGLTVQIERWEEHKGIDDALLAGAPIETLEGDDAAAFVESLAEVADKPDQRKAVGNYKLVMGADEAVPFPLSMGAIVQFTKDATDDWPRRMGTALFVHEGDEIAWLEKTPAFGGYVGAKTGHPPDFRGKAGFHTLSETFEEFRRTATSYKSVEVLPHHPVVADTYYACETPKPGDGKALRELVEFFTPETPIDGDLILAAFVTPGWGGTGKRPSIGITSSAGRGSGKTTLAKMIGRVWGGIIDIAADEASESVKQRLLSPEGITKRVALIDNLKSMRFSSASLESLVTAENISGKRMYVGEGTRPNNLTWITTLNGVSFATDWAQRSVIIKLQKPDYSGAWQDKIEAFIDANRDKIIADAITFLRSPGRTLERFTRWANWERDVLSRLPEPAEAQAVIRDRQADADAEGEEVGTLQDHIREQIAAAHFSPESDRVFIPSKLAATWLSDVTGDRCGTTKASRFIRQHIREGKLNCIAENDCKAFGRGFVWNGSQCDMDENIKTDIEARMQRNNQY